jgi:hypothetical protein
MHSPRQILLEECGNLQQVLDETLRFDYGIQGSEEFYVECQARLAFIRSELLVTLDNDHQNLQKNGILLHLFSDLLSRIERSSIEQYSWPFVDELKKIALALCREDTITGNDTPPLVFVLSEGGLGAYEIKPEMQRPSGASRRIHTITLPRTLKHFVLLHSILGHEVGHAMLRCSKHQAALLDVVHRVLLPGGVLATPASAAAWIYAGAAAPISVRQQLAVAQTQIGLTQANIWTKYDYSRWIEEILCDFLGILTFGPSFVAAESNVLYSLDASGTQLGPYHPPTGCRINYLLSASRLLGHSTRQLANAGLSKSVTEFWTKLEAKRQNDPWFNLFTDQKIQEIAVAMTAIITPLPPAMYKPPDEGDLLLFTRQLADAVPPVASYLDESKSVRCKSVDFRSILEAGWITASTQSSLTFSQLNRLCEHGILQQKAVDIALNP